MSWRLRGTSFPSEQPMRTPWCDLVRRRTPRGRSGRCQARPRLEPLEARTLPSFGPPITLPTGRYPSAVAVADFNGDGNPDLATANQGTSSGVGSVSVLLGHGSGNFRSAGNFAVGRGPSAVAAGDFNHDGRVHLAVADSVGNTVGVLLGNGDGTFSAPRRYRVGPRPVWIAVRDLNADGNPDLAVADNGGGVSVLLGTRAGVFHRAHDYAAGISPTSIVAADFDRDGTVDLAVTGYDFEGSLTLLRGNGDGTFQAPVTYRNLSSRSVTVAAGDFNGDGVPDVAVGNNFGLVDVLLDGGDGTFTNAGTFDLNYGATSVAVGDFNQDGNADVAAATTGDSGLPGSGGVLLGNGDGTFQPPVSEIVETVPRAVAVGDFNRDGFPDLVTANGPSNNASVYLNEADWSTAANRPSRDRPPGGAAVAEEPQRARSPAREARTVPAGRAAPAAVRPASLLPVRPHRDRLLDPDPWSFLD